MKNLFERLKKLCEDKPLIFLTGWMIILAEIGIAFVDYKLAALSLLLILFIYFPIVVLLFFSIFMNQSKREDLYFFLFDNMCGRWHYIIYSWWILFATFGFIRLINFFVESEKFWIAYVLTALAILPSYIILIRELIIEYRSISRSDSISSVDHKGERL